VIGGLANTAVVHFSSAFPRGRDPRLMWGLKELCISKFSGISPPVGDFFLAKSPVFGDAKDPTDFRTLFPFFEQFADTRTLHSDEN